MTGSQESPLKKASVDTGGIDINALIDGSGIVLDKQKMIGESILQLHEGNAVDESINSYEYDEYQPIGTQLNSDGQITITIENQDQFLLKADNARYADAHLIVLTNNGFVYLFSSMKLTLAGQMVEHVNYPGQVARHKC